MGGLEPKIDRDAQDSTSLELVVCEMEEHVHE